MSPAEPATPRSAAVAGGSVTGLDITPELFEAARRRAGEAGVEVSWIEGDAEELPFDDAGFDVVLSTFGCMFAPNHDVAAAEIARVLRPGGCAAIAAWRPDGSIGDFFRSLAGFAPEPPPGFQPPPLWGDRAHVEEIFAPTRMQLRFEDAAVRLHFDSLEQAADEYWEKFGPVVTLRAMLEPQGRGAELRDALVGSLERSIRPEGDGVSFDGEYLITVGRKSG